MNWQRKKRKLSNQRRHREDLGTIVKLLTISETGRILDVLSLFMMQLCGFGQSFQS